MRLKNYRLKAHCDNCHRPVYMKSFIVNMSLIKNDEHLNALLLDQFPVIKCCQNCGERKIVKSYSYLTIVKLLEGPSKSDLEAIERAQNQIAATYDFNNHLSALDRKVLREAFQNQLNDLLTKNNITK